VKGRNDSPIFPACLADLLRSLFELLGDEGFEQDNIVDENPFRRR